MIKSKNSTAYNKQRSQIKSATVSALYCEIVQQKQNKTERSK